jgi:surface polysaccharide O-acyltransferase-like enzyme
MCTQSLFFESNKLQILDFLAKLAVPFFFMVSGYYLFNKKQEYILTQIKKLFTIYITSLLILSFAYTALNKFQNDWNFNENSIPDYIFQNRLTFIPTINITWYLLASIYIYIYVCI